MPEAAVDSNSQNLQHQDTKTQSKDFEKTAASFQLGRRLLSRREAEEIQHQDTESQSTELDEGESPIPTIRSHRGPIEPIPEGTNRIARQIVDSAFKVHSTLGPGLLESVYEACLVYELTKRGLAVKSQVELPLQYDGMTLPTALRLDLVVEDLIIVEVKAVESLVPVHTAQVLTYLKLTGQRLGFLINFNSALIKNGIKRIAF